MDFFGVPGEGRVRYSKASTGDYGGPKDFGALVSS